MTKSRQSLYLDLIDRLLRSPHDREPEILNAQPELLDAGLVQTAIEVATLLAHEGNPDGAKFLVRIARDLSRQLGLFPQLSTAGGQSGANGN